MILPLDGAHFRRFPLDGKPIPPLDRFDDRRPPRAFLAAGRVATGRFVAEVGNGKGERRSP